MLTYVEVNLENYPVKWTSGKEVISATVTLGQGEKSSSCSIVLADPTGTIGAALINHSLASGGITKLPDSQATKPDNIPAQVLEQPTPADAKAWETAIVRQCLASGVKDSQQIAYVLATAQAESSMGVYLEEIASGAAYEGRRDLGNTQPGDGKRFKGRGLVQVTGRANYVKWSKKLGIDAVGDPNILKQPKYALVTLVVGMLEGTYTGKNLNQYIGNGKADFVGARRIINGQDRAAEIAGFATAYLAKLPAILQEAGAASANLPEKTVAEPPTPNTPMVKGNKLFVDIAGYGFEFYHQGTLPTSEGTTTITGQGIRWVLNRRKRNKTEQNLKLSELAGKIAKAHGVQLSYLADVNLLYEHIDQTGLSDYQLLKRECDRAGLFLSEEKGTLTIKSLRNITETSLVMQTGVNLISWQIQDAAVDSSSEDAGTSLLQSEPKINLNPITGQFEPTKQDIDVVSDTSVTGKDKTKPAGKLQAGQEAVADQNRARVKRVKGLPSSFTVVLNDTTLGVKPLDAVRTVGLPGVLSRVWLVDSVTHNVTDGTSTLACYSPVEVIDNSPTPANLSDQLPATGSSAPTGSYQWPLHGVVTSLVGYRNHPVRGGRRMHNGTDISVPTGTPVAAAGNGVVTKLANQPSGAGMYIVVTHSTGWTTTYMHLSAFRCKQGQSVRAGENIALSGNTGGSTGAHLHFEIRDGSHRVMTPQQAGLGDIKDGSRV